MRKLEPEVKLQPQAADKKTIRTIYDYSKYTFISMLAMQLVYYSDAFVIGYFLTAAAITIYTIPWSLSEYTNKLILAIAHVYKRQIRYFLVQQIMRSTRFTIFVFHS